MHFQLPYVYACMARSACCGSRSAVVAVNLTSISQSIFSSSNWGQKGCIRASVSVCIATQVSIPNCHDIMTQHASTGENMKFESALGCNCQRSVASCFCLAQPKAQASRGAQVHMPVSSSAIKVRKPARQHPGNWKRLHSK